jgi:hypothetical protein
VKLRPFFIIFVAAFCAALFSVLHAPLVVHASQLSFVSDTISDSRDAWPANHTIVFKVANAIPASGQLVVAFEGQSFLIDPSFSYTDVDLAVSAVSASSGFVERSVAANPDATDDGVAITPITGPITITLASSGGGIPAGSYVRIMFGTNAPAGFYQITNPATTTSYRILLNTYNNSSASLDYGAAMVAILPGVGVTANTDKLNPAVLSNGMPSGTIPSNISGVLVSFNTDTFATCRYSTTASTTYDSMVLVTTNDALGKFHTFSVTGIVKGTTYTYYARCQDFADNQNPNDYIISFTAGPPTGTGLGGGQPGDAGNVSAGSGGGGGGGGGGGAPFPPLANTPSLFIHGVTIPGASIAVLEDGAKISTVTTADSSGNFSLNISSLPQGTYSFTVQALNSGSTVISSYNATITLITGTTNSITGIVLPPTIGFTTSTVALNKAITISGFSEPSSTVDIVVTSQESLQNPFEASTTANQTGAWSYTLSTAGFPMDTYQIKARSLVIGLAASNYSSISFLGVGEAANPKLKVGDLNNDGKINLVDFSILLAHWGTSYASDDLNGNGTVDLPDLSILLFHWTG